MNSLKSLKDEKLINNIKNKNCSNSLIELADRHGGMCFSIGKKYVSFCGLDLNELNDNKYWIIFNAAKSFNSDKGSKFSTWLGNQIRFFCLNYKNKNNKLLPVENVGLDYFNYILASDSEENKKNTLEIITELFNQISDPNTKNAIYYRYFYNKDRILNYSEIAQILKVTPQTVLNWHNKFINLAKKKLTNEKIDTKI